jgi:hypothetical protein
MVAFEEPAPPPQRREQQALRTADAHYWAMAGLASGATVSNVELITRCSACTLVPGGIRGSRGALYGIGIPVAVAADYLGYRIKRNRSRTWVVPMAVVTALNIGYAIHAAHTTF